MSPIDPLVGDQVTVVEPHADDAYLSLHDHIKTWVKAGVDVEIHTVYGGTRRRSEDAATYARAVGARWSTSGLSEAGTADGGDVVDDPPIDLPLLGRYVWPLGLRHPEHRAVARVARRLDPAALFYVEIPYQRLGPCRAELIDRLTDLTVVSYRWPHASKHADRWRAMFTDQKMFFRYNPPERLAAPEMIVR